MGEFNVLSPYAMSAQFSAAKPPGLVAERLKTLRHGMGLTLQDLAQRSGVSISNLSKIERGDVSPSFDVVMRICEGFGIPPEQFVKPGPKTSVSGRKTVTRRGEAVPFSSDEYNYLAHASELSRKTMVPLEIWVRARSAEQFGHWSVHNGEEFVYVISGSIEIHTDQYEPFILEAGDSAYFDSAMKHIYVSIGDCDAHVLSVSHNPDAADRARVEGFMNPTARPAPPVAVRRNRCQKK